MSSKKEIEKKLDYARGYRDALVDTWESVIKLVTKGYSSRELQIMGKTQYRDARLEMEAKIAKLEADFAQDDIIDIDEKPRIQPAARVKVPALRPGMSIMFKEPKPVKCYELFETEIAAGRLGICVARTSPSEIRDNYKIGRSRVIWLTTTEKNDINLPPSALGLSKGMEDNAVDADDIYVPPSGSGLPNAYAQILNFMEGNKGAIVLLEGIEYVKSHAPFKSVLNFLQLINENVKRLGCNLIISANPSAFDPMEISQLETEMNQVI